MEDGNLPEVDFAITAATGIASSHLPHGQTFHSFLGVGKVDELDHFKRMWEERKKERFRKLKLLVIDEISMISGSLLDAVDQMFRAIRNDDKPFGGIRVIFCGDFLQLPPVTDERQCCASSLEDPDLFFNFGKAFQSVCFQEMNPTCVVLNDCKRQKDVDFYNLLCKVRLRQPMTDAERILLQERHVDPPEDSEFKPTRLFPLKNGQWTGKRM